MNSNELKEKYAKIKELLRRVTSGEEVDISRDIKELLSTLEPWEIVVLEQQLANEGLDYREIAAMCEAHVNLFRESLSKKHGIEVPEGHPLRTLYDENSLILKDAEMMGFAARSGDIKNANALLSRLQEIRKHYMRIQMLLFPYLERAGINAIPRVLWQKQDEVIDKLREATKNNELSNVLEASKLIIDEIFREDNILLPTMWVILPEGAWVAIRKEEKWIGYYHISPPAWEGKEPPLYPYEFNVDASEFADHLPPQVREIALTARRDRYELVRKGDINMGTGYLTPTEIKNIFKALPIDISFIDSKGRLRFYSFPTNEKRIFARTRTVLGRPVALCHPPKSVHIVSKIIGEFRKGTKNQANFWIKIGKRFIVIRYFPVRDEKGEYLGTLEVVQDATWIRDIKGERRLLEWD